MCTFERIWQIHIRSTNNNYHYNGGENQHYKFTFDATIVSNLLLNDTLNNANTHTMLHYSLLSATTTTTTLRYIYQRCSCCYYYYYHYNYLLLYFLACCGLQLWATTTIEITTTTTKSHIIKINNLYLLC